MLTFVILIILYETVNSLQLSPKLCIKSHPAAASLAVSLGFFLAPIPALADVASARSGLEQVYRVRLSLNYVNQDIERGSGVGDIIKQIKLLLTNYQLKDNIRKSMELIPKPQREDARTHGIAAFEDLSTIFEYFKDDIDEATGSNIPNSQVMKLAYDATKAASIELDTFVKDIPPDIASEIQTKIEREFNY
jgi:hypothetical protein